MDGMFGKILLLVFGLSVASAGQKDPELCLVQPDMKPSYLKTSLFKKTDAQGCFSSFSTSKSQEIHFIRVEKVTSRFISQVSNHVLDIFIKQLNKDENLDVKLVLVLDIPPSVDVNIDSIRVKSNSSHLLTISGTNDRAITSSHLNFKLKENNKSALQLVRSIKKKYGGLTSYTVVQEAAQILLRIGKVPGAPSLCNVKTLSKSPVSLAWSLQQTSMSGCFHPDLIGTGSSDVHILEIGSTCSSLEPDDASRPVLINLSSTVPTTRNVTLILKSKKEVVWNVDAVNIDGAIRIEADHPVGLLESLDVSRITVTKKAISKQFDWLILEATSQHGAPVTYAKADEACLIELSVEQRQQDNTQALKQSNNKEKHSTSKFEDQLSSEEQYSALFKPFGLQYLPMQQSGASETWIDKLAAEVSIRCIKSTEEVEITVPRNVVDSIGLSSHQLTLGDPLCHAFLKDTQYIIESAYNSCGAVMENEGQNVVYRNQLKIRQGPDMVDDEDWEAGSGLSDYQRNPSIAFQCETPRRASHLVRSEQDSHVPALHHRMELYSDWQMTRPLPRKDSQPIVQIVGQVIYVRVTSEYSPGLGLVLERCWLTHSSHLPHSNPRYLLMYGCPAGKLVRENIIGETYSSFSFQVEEDMTGKHYLHCQVGVCGTLSTRLPLLPCLQTHECGGEFSMKRRMFPGDTTVVSIGPIVVKTEEAGKAGQVPMIKQLALFEVGVSLEVAIGVAFASFALGVILTGILWFIRQKTDPINTNCRKRSSNSGSDILRQSYTSSPSSQSSMESRLKDPVE